MLVHGKKFDARPVQQNVLRAVAVVDVEIKHGDALGTGGRRFERGDGDVVEIAEAHGFFARGVVAGRAHEAENIFAGAGNFQRVQRGGNGRAGVAGNVFKERRVGIEIFRRFEAGEHFGRVGAEDLLVVSAGGRNPSERQLRLAFQQCGRVRNALRAFRVAGARIAGARFVGDDGHGNLRYTICDLRAAGKFQVDTQIAYRKS